MNTLKPGFIPDGWTPGCGVRLLPAPEPGRRGAVLHAPDGRINFDGRAGDVAMVTFAFEDTAEVGHWLEWWRA